MQRQTYPEQVSLLYKQSQTGLLLSIPAALILYGLQYGHVDTDYLNTWLIAGLLLAAVRSVLIQRYKHAAPQTDQDIHNWILPYQILMTVSGFAWGSIMFLPGDKSSTEEFAALFILGGVAAAASGTLASLMRVYIPFIVALSLPPISWMIYLGSTEHLMIAGLLTVFTLGLLATGIRQQETLQNTLRLAREKSALIEQLSQTSLLAEQANTAKSEFLSRMSHELRTPMNAILGFAQLIRSNHDEPLTADQEEGLDEILIAGDHLLHLINEVLDLSKIESGTLEITPQALSADELVEATTKLVRATAQKKSIRITQQVDEALPKLYADPMRVRQVLLNLLSNAIKYTHDQGTVEVLASREAEHIVITVADSGIGIEQSELKQIFEPFIRLPSNGNAVEGTGIGLTITHKLMELMHGHIQVESRVGIGSRFQVFFPLAGDKAGPEPL